MSVCRHELVVEPPTNPPGNSNTAFSNAVFRGAYLVAHPKDFLS